MKKAVFLDRDGVINREIGDYVFSENDFEVNDGVVEAIKLLKENDFLVIIITNQGGIAKGIFSEKDFWQVMKKLDRILYDGGVKIDEVYFCPHHPDVMSCLCRKPEPLMIEKAIARFNIDVQKSYMIGDSPRDVLAAEKVGVKGILIESNSNLMNVAKLIVAEVV